MWYSGRYLSSVLRAYGALTRFGRLSQTVRLPNTFNSVSPTTPPRRVVWASPLSLATTRGILSFPRVTEMFQFTRFPPLRVTSLTWLGFPIRRSPVLTFTHNLPELIAVYRVLHRHLTPRHPPCALTSFTPCDTEKRTLPRLASQLLLCALVFLFDVVCGC